MSPYVVLHGVLTKLFLISLLLTLFLPLVCISIYIYRTLAVMVGLVQMSRMMCVECVEGTEGGRELMHFEQ